MVCCIFQLIYTANTIHRPSVGLMSGHRLRHWPNIKTTLVQSLVFTGAVCVTVKWITSYLPGGDYVKLGCKHRWSPRTGVMVEWLKLPAWKVGDRGLEPRSGIQVSKKQNVSSPLTRKDSINIPQTRVKVSIVGSLRDREGTFSASDRQGSNFQSCVRRAVSYHSSHHR